MLSITQIHAGSAYNVIPGEAKLCGTVRAFSDEVRALIRERMRAICAGIATAFQVEIIADIRDTFSVLVNQEEQSRVVEEVARTVVDPAKVITRSQPKMGSEDFADMMQAVPGAYFWVGHDGSVPVHNPGYVLDDKILPDRRQHVRAHHRNPASGRRPCISRHRKTRSPRCTISAPST